jgi:hypothetical protein
LRRATQRIFCDGERKHRHGRCAGERNNKPRSCERIIPKL